MNEEFFCNEMKTVFNFTYLGVKVGISVGCMSAVAGMIRFWVGLESLEIMWSEAFPMKPKESLQELFLASKFVLV